MRVLGTPGKGGMNPYCLFVAVDDLVEFLPFYRAMFRWGRAQI
jgi:hypothetical protein